MDRLDRLKETDAPFTTIPVQPMSVAEFVHLRVHTAYSLSEGAIRLPELASMCQRHGMPAVAVADTNNLFGALEFSLAMGKAGVQPIIGCQLSITPERREHEGMMSGNGRAGRTPEPQPLALLAQNEAGYQNLLKLTSKAFLETEPSEDPQVSLANLAGCSDGLICLTGAAAGPVGKLLADGQMDAAEALLLQLAGLFPGRLYVELQRHNLPLERQVEPALIDLAYKHDLPLIATNACFFADQDMFDAHDALLCVANSSYVAETDRLRLTPDHRFKSPEEMKVLFADLPEAVANTLVVAQRCAVMAPVRDPILPSFSTDGGRSEADEMAARSREGLEKRLEDHVFTPDMDAAAREETARPYRERLEYEIGVITKMDFPGYFLIVADFIQWAKARGIPVGPGRGSGAGSVVAWALTITDLDPLRFGLLFERFLNPERVSMPDFDVDFCQDRRDEVIRYVQDKYGHGNVAQIITFGKLQARAALRDVGRVLQLPFKQVDRICKLVPNNPAKPVTLQQALDMVPKLKEERRADEGVDRMMSIALKLEGLYRHASTHAAGVVLGDRPLDELVPLYRDPRSDMPVTQFSMKWAETSGLVKFDFLGLKTLTVLDRACGLLKRRGVDLTLDDIPLEDTETFEMLGRGESVGVFQLEGSGMRDVLRQLKPDTFEDIIALVALYRPGPMDNIPRFCNTKHGREEPDYLHEWIKPIVEETYGVIVYQEQVMQIAQVLAGYSLGEADLLRRAMGKKIQAEMDAQRERFISGAVEKGVAPDRATTIFELVDKFAGYGFNKSHAAAYALVAWHTAWMKCKYPHEFMAASMTFDLGNTDKINVFRQELQRMDIDLRSPDVNASADEFIVETDADGKPEAIRYALAAVKNVGREAMRAVVSERTAEGPYRDLFDFAQRLDPSVLNKRQVENLARAGAFDSLNPNRAQTFASVELLVRHANGAAAERGSGQTSLFGGAGEGIAMQMPALPDVDPWLPTEQLAQEYDAIGFYLSAHPIDVYTKPLAQKGVRRAADLLGSLNGNTVTAKIAGTLMSRRDHRSARGTALAFIQASDPSGIFEITMFSEQLAQYGEMLETGRSLVFMVEARMDGERARLTVQSVYDIDIYTTDAAAGVRVFCDDGAPFGGLKSVLGKTGSGKGMVMLVLRLDDRDKEVEIEVPERFAITPAIRQSLKGVRGVVDVQEI